MSLGRSSAIGMFLGTVALLAVAMSGSARAELITPHAATPETVTPHAVAPAPAPESAAPEPEYVAPTAEPAPEIAAPETSPTEEEAHGAGTRRGNRGGTGGVEEQKGRPETSPSDPSCDYNCLGDWIVYGRGVVDQAGNPFATASIPIETRVSIFFHRLELELAVQQLEEELRSKWGRRPPPRPAPTPTASSDSLDPDSSADGDLGDAACRNGNGDEAEEQVEDGGSGSVACR
jgi:hypothetical protein